MGVFRETANFNNPSSFSSNTLQSVSEGTGFNSADIFIAKFEETLGTLTWIRRAGGTNEDYPSSIAIDNTSIYITGTSRSGVLNFNTPSNTSTNILTNFFSGIFSGFLAKYNTSGTYQWSRRFGGDYYAWGKSVIAKDGNVYVAGEYSDDMSFSQNSYTYGASGNLISAFDPFLDIDEGFIAKYNSSGTIQWYKRSGGTINDMVLSEDGLSIYTIGKFAIDGVNFNNPSNYNSNTLFVPSSQYSKFYIYAGYFAKFNTDGAYQWSLQNSQSSDENLADELGTGISLKGSRIFTTAYARRNLGLIKCFFEGSISTNSLSGSSFCAGTNILVPFSTLGVFDAGNSFKVELSNAAGVFPTKNGYIGTGIVSPLTSTLPANASGTNYKVRVVSTNPVIVGSPTPIFGNGFDIIAASDAGTVTGGTTVCTGTNSTTLTLNNKVGNVLYWQGSVNPAFNSSVTTFNSTSTSLTLTDRTVGAYYRAVVQNGNCPLDYSASAQVAVSPTTVAGTLSSVNGIFCAGINNNTINLTGNVGNVLKWQSSSSSAFTSSVDINNTSSSLNVTNINTTTYYRAVVKSGACAEANTGNRQIAISSTAVTLNNSNPLNSVTFPVKSNFTITGQNAITGSSNVLFRSNKSVELKPGFRAESGTVFKAEIGGCN
ncbi:MAG TPA: hypothetical protein DCM71_26510 [Runella sp.]|nr:hypothetical protein [Runella sp.]